MKVLIACEYSGVVRRAFRALGHDAFSCDLLPADDASPYHLQGDVRLALITGRWDLMVAHPPCTDLAVSGARWFKYKAEQQREALAFVQMLMDANVPRIAVENPVSIISSRIRKPDQIIQPHQFGHPEFKATCLWLKGLPKLVATSPLDVPPRGGAEWKAWSKVHRMPPGADRWKKRSTTYTGIAAAMALQWGGVADE